MYVALTFNCVFLVGMMYVISCIGLAMSCYVITLIGTINVCGCKSIISQSISYKSVILYVVPLAACKLNSFYIGKVSMNFICIIQKNLAALLVPVECNCCIGWVHVRHTPFRYFLSLYLLLLLKQSNLASTTHDS